MKATGAQPLQIVDLVGVFYVFAFGCVVSLLFALIDLTYRKIKFRKQRSLAPKLIFGTMYKGKISDIREEGISVMVPSQPKDFFLANKNPNPGRYEVQSAEKMGIRKTDEVVIKYFGKETGAKRFTLITVNGKLVNLLAPALQSHEQESGVAALAAAGGAAAAIEMQPIRSTASGSRSKAHADLPQREKINEQ